MCLASFLAFFFFFFLQSFVFSFFLCLFRACFGFSGVSLPLESFLGRQCVVSDFQWFSFLSSVQIKPESLYWASSFRIIFCIGLSFPQSSLLLHLVQTLWYCPKHMKLILSKTHENYTLWYCPKHMKTICPCTYCSLGNLLTVRQERNVTCYLDWSDCSKLVSFLVQALW